jgi:predicted MPP superfamily phosphohydrolase
VRPLQNRTNTISRRKFLRRSLLGGLLLAAPTGVYASEIEPEDIQVARVDVRIPGLPEAADGLLIGHLSDIHCDCPRAVQRAARAAKLLRSKNPDVVFLTGDYITHKAHERMPAAAEALQSLSDAPFGSFAVLGNHDWWSGDPDFVEEQLKNAGITVLRNRSVLLRNHDVWAVGLEQRCDNLQNPELALRGVPKDAIKLLLIHEPDYADEAPAGFALQFSGHSHGGQVRIPGLPPLHVPTYGRRYPEGLQQAKNHLVYTTRGVGMIGPKVRLFCPPEVAVIRLIRA